MATLQIDAYDDQNKLIETSLLTVSDRDEASARLYRLLNDRHSNSFRDRTMARFGDGESDFKVIEPNSITHFQFFEHHPWRAVV